MIYSLKMAFAKSMTESEYTEVLRRAWAIELDVEAAFPPEVAKWISYNATLTGVPSTYIK